MRNLFLTGASGCLGHYVLERLAQQRDPDFPEQPAYHLYVLIRETSRLRLPLERLPAPITWVPGDLLRIREHAALLRQMDGLIHMAAAWGDPALAWAVNVTHTLELFQLLDPERCQQVIYFSTASLLNQDLEPLAIAGRAGTDYIRSKYEMLLRRQESGFWPERLLTLHLVWGGLSLLQLGGGFPDELHCHLLHLVQQHRLPERVLRPHWPRSLASASPHLHRARPAPGGEHWPSPRSHRSG